MLPLVIRPMLAQKAEAPFDSDQHLFEIKWDGIRCLAFVEGGRVRLQSRRQTEITAQFPELAGLGWLPTGTVLDGELVVLREGKPSLRDIQERVMVLARQRIRILARTTPAKYIVFDLLYLKGKALTATPLSLRRRALHDLFAHCSLPDVSVSEPVRQHGCQLFAQVASRGLEGIMAKRLDGPYLPGKRSGFWLKIKPMYHRQLP